MPQRSHAKVYALALAALLVLVPTMTALATTDIYSANGNVWDVYDITDWDTGGIDDGGDDAFDSFGMISMYVADGSGGYVDDYEDLEGFGLTWNSGERFASTTPVTIGDIETSRALYAPASANYLRYIDTFTNTAASTRRVWVIWGGNLGSDSSTTLASTSSGDLNISPADEWVITIENSEYDPAGPAGDPPVGYALGLEGNLVFDAAVGYYDGYPYGTWSGNGDDDLGFQYYLELEPGETVKLAYFLYRGLVEADPPPAGSEIALAESVLTAIVADPASHFSDVSAADKNLIANWYFPVVVSPSSWNFGNQDLGTTSTAKTFTLTNNNTVDLILDTLSITGDFALDTDDCSDTTIAAGATCTFAVTFSPTAAGARTGSVSIPSDADSSPDSVALRGRGLDPSVTTILYATVANGDTTPATSTLVELDSNDGSLVATIGPVGYLVNGLDYDPVSGLLYASTSSRDDSFPSGLLTIDTDTGAGTPIGSGFGMRVTNVRANAAGNLFGWTEDSDDLVSINATTGVATVVGDSDMSTSTYGLSFNAAGTLYYVGWEGIYIIDTATGAGTYTGNTVEGEAIAHHGDFHPETDLYWGIDDIGSGPKNLLVVNATSGSVSATLPTVDDLHTIAFANLNLGTLSAPASVPLDGTVVTYPGPTQLTVTFSRTVNHVSDSDPGSALNVDNYILVEGGSNGAIDTTGCPSASPGDTEISINSIAYDDATFTVTLNINFGIPLPTGTYSLFVCGTTSVEDPLGNELNGGAFDTRFDFSVGAATAAAIPDTGFAPNRVTLLPEQTASYAETDLWLEIPRLGVQMDIVGVPQAEGEWDVTWLGQNAGWLEGSAFPTWEGNSVITGHVWNADNTAGPFRYVNTLWYGDQIVVHAWGAEYVYSVRSVLQVGPGSTAQMLKHEELPWVTLVTCRGYDAATDSYRYRVLVRAVLVEVR